MLFSSNLQVCYDVDIIPEGNWYCTPCTLGQNPRSLTCVLCSTKGGAYSRTDKKGKWVHNVCAKWIPNVGNADINATHGPPVIHTDTVVAGRWNLRCIICKEKGSGACIQCAHKQCCTAVHPICVFTRPNEFHRNYETEENTVLCKKHSPKPGLIMEVVPTQSRKSGSILAGKAQKAGSSSSTNKSNTSGTARSQTSPRSSSNRHSGKPKLAEPTSVPALSPMESRSLLSNADADVIIDKLKAHIHDRELVRLLFNECLLNAFASGTYRENSPVSEKRDWAVEKLVQRNEASLLRALHYYDLINLRARVKNKPTLLYLAVEGDLFECCEMLLDLGTNIDAYSHDKGPMDSALHCAAKFGFIDILNLLLERGARVDIPNHSDETPLVLATRAGSVEGVKSLLRYGALATIKTKAGDDAVIIAARERHMEILSLLVAASTPSSSSSTSGAMAGPLSSPNTGSQAKSKRALPGSVVGSVSSNNSHSSSSQQRVTKRRLNSISS